MVTGTSWKDSSRLRAVTMISSISVVCAVAGNATAAARMPITAVERQVPLDVGMNVSALRVRLQPYGPGCARHLRAEDGGPCDHRLELSGSGVPAQILESAVGRDDEVLGAHEGQRAADPRRNDLRRLDLGAPEVEDAEHDFLAVERLENGAVELRLGGLEGNLLTEAARELGQEGVRRRSRVDDRGIAKADVDR